MNRHEAKTVREEKIPGYAGSYGHPVYRPAPKPYEYGVRVRVVESVGSDPRPVVHQDENGPFFVTRVFTLTDPGGFPETTVAIAKVPETE